MPARVLRPAIRVTRAFADFFKWESSGSVMLLAATIAALAWANSPFARSYVDLWHSSLTLGISPLSLTKDLQHWVNDGLMAIFFLLVGLEIKRELVEGELSTRSAAALPVAAAAGGMIFPALIYAAITREPPALNGWAIPMATDIAFALGALAVLGRRAPVSLRVFLVALAIVDDIGAVLVIALVYTPTIQLVALGIAAALTIVLVGFNRANVTSVWPYALVGVLLWIAVLKSGVHATIAGIVLALTIPASGSARTTDPLERMEHALTPWVAFAIIPIFALANAGVSVAGVGIASLASPVGLGVILGLVIGKQVGVLAGAWIAVRTGLAELPGEITWRYVWGAGWLAGIGFTMALFVNSLALPPEMQETAKLSILVASVIALAGGVAVCYPGRTARMIAAAK